MSTKAPISVKRNNYHENPKDFCIFTPPEIAYFIHDIISYHYPYIQNILDVCCGDGNLSEPWSDYDSPKNIVGIDNQTRKFDNVGCFVKADFLCHTQLTAVGDPSNEKHFKCQKK